MTACIWLAATMAAFTHGAAMVEARHRFGLRGKQWAISALVPIALWLALSYLRVA